ncbi:DDE-type integrase/transposase/recombinase [Actinoplanes flavus]|uniref:DDE-type integrase/transposase/recombinase n=1 Tax=Actinoplanes flavus TaxID=2820290 RepID=UPI0035562DBC
MPKPYPREFRDAVVRVARDREPGVTVEHIAKDFGVHPMTLFKWLRQAGIDEAPRPAGAAATRPSCVRPASESSCSSSRTRSYAGPRRICRRRTCRERLYPLVSKLAADGVPVAVTCRVAEHRSTALLPVARPAGYRRRPGRGLSGGRVVRRPPRRPGLRLPVPGRRSPRCRATDGRTHCLEDLLRHGLVERVQPQTRRGKSSRPGLPVHHDLVCRDFTTDGPNRLWLADITEYRTSEGKLYLCAIKDVWSKRIGGYSIDSRMKSRLAVTALRNAVARRGEVAGCVLHTDRGSQFRSRRLVHEPAPSRHDRVDGPRRHRRRQRRHGIVLRSPAANANRPRQGRAPPATPASPDQGRTRPAPQPALGQGRAPQRQCQPAVSRPSGNSASHTKAVLPPATPASPGPRPSSPTATPTGPGRGPPAIPTSRH